jgi:hypothetical protein
MFLVLACIFFLVGCKMITKLRQFYKDFYKEFGCQLWTANILMTLPLSFRALFNALTFCDAWQNYWFGPEATFYQMATYNVGLFVFATYIPMLMQIFSLIFGFMRNKKVKLFRTYADNDNNDRQHRNRRHSSDEDNNNSDDEATSQTFSTNTHTSDNSFFDPPIENYRFYY